MSFDPRAHRVVPAQRWFEDFCLHERFVLPSRTMTDALFAAFQLASGDNHPVHYDAEYCRAHGMPGLWITCDPENKGSRRTCEIVGAECIETVWLPMGHPLRAQGSTRKCRYWWDMADPGACEPA